jgi:DNA-directed RNA polymerase subunit RPC12/RpoP
VTIQFRCPYCDKSLKASDDKAGRRVKCPTCGNTITVEETQKTFESPVQPEIDHGGLEESTFEPTHQPPSSPVPFDAGEVIGTSWEIYKTQLGVAVVAVLIVLIINIAIIVMGAIAAEIATGVAANLAPRNNAAGPGITVLSLAIQFGSLIVNWLLQTFLTVGQTILFLKIARGQPAEVGDLFSGGPYFLRALGCTFLFGIMIAFGIILLIVPGIIAALMFWPFLYVLVDTNAPGLDCFSRAREITQNTWGNVILLWLTAFGLGILGVLACCVGTLFTTPLVMLIFAVAYCRMTGQPTARG